MHAPRNTVIHLRPLKDASNESTAWLYPGSSQECREKVGKLPSVTILVLQCFTSPRAAGASQITAGSRELSGMIQQLCRFQQSALASTAELRATVATERDGRHINMPGQVFSGAAVSPQDQVKTIKSQQTCASRERVKMIQGIQSMTPAHGTDRGAAARSVLTGFGEEDV
ncbi:hypothetical protein CDD83_10831 [Cordyceps sp. RAO-2017]|nr:hypothetical protein CDD83_10831 [Cordyceps sp. RAO-2017]